MTAPRFHFLVLLGRFQPLHNGHLALIQAALKQTGQLIILCGSAQQARSTRNPWSAAEREHMLRSALDDADNARVHVVPVADHLYNQNAWVRDVQAGVNNVVQRLQTGDSPRIGLAECNSSAWFPQWEPVALKPDVDVRASAIRDALFQRETDTALPEAICRQLPASVANWLQAFSATPDCATLRDEFHFVREFKQSWSAAPYPPVFTTVDALVVCGGHILLVERNGRPGKGLLALPGGFLDQTEPLMDACLRELAEETCLDLPTDRLKSAIRAQRVFDAPFRSARGRTLTHAFHLELPAVSPLPRVMGADDAKRAFWLPLAALSPEPFFEDHYSIIRVMLGL